MQTIIKNNTPLLLDTKSIKEQVNVIKEDYMNTNIQILKATATQAILTEDITLYELLIWDSSEEPIKGTPENYLDDILDYIDYAKDYDCNIRAKIEIISKEEKLSKITLSLTF
nr:MAG TPA: hypothetical protein [Caudoviricetes sp.]